MGELFVMCTRRVRSGRFIAEPGPVKYLLVPENELPKPAHAVREGGEELWFNRLKKAASWGIDSRDPQGKRPRGDLLVFVHGYNNDQKTVMARHRRLKRDLAAAGFRGEVMSFDWPSANMALNYLEDRHDAKQTALQLVTAGIRVLSEQQEPDCAINVHLLGHSTGAYVIREAFDDADDAKLPNTGWMASQVVFIGADVSSDSLRTGSDSSASLYRHCVRLTNYSSQYDSVLKLSNVKRAGMAPRAGRVGLPPDAPEKAVDVDCTEYFGLLRDDAAVKEKDQAEVIGAFDHSWHIGNQVFARDLFETLRGDLDRHILPTRYSVNGKLKLKLKRP
jgi:pimeloyl-ACP methyl ester carboxylesterase